ncbi:uncharacterized protein LOC116613026 isoform X2 [Nematostella vectensis]|uniref:uncharacterized protein LOC116613026 isoform X2 n=1 Tax=Nematostella vectensis TaxID=45351 RepID=UPI0020770AB7|nr:uncharacterized protein LOC116613026 isoform X2 [Nematostella vectensis]
MSVYIVLVLYVIGVPMCHVMTNDCLPCRYIGMSVYNVFVLCVIGVPMFLVMRDHPDACNAIVAISIIFCTSITLCLVFIPKVMEMRRMMAVGGRPENVFTSNSLARANLHLNTMGTIDELNRQLADFKAKLSKRAVRNSSQSLKR